MKIYYRPIIAFILLSVAQLATAATAPPPSDAELSMSHLRLSIWPEYDDPRVLVMLRGEMTPSQAFPTHITLPLPKGAEVIGAGMVSEFDELILHPHRVIAGDELDTLDLNLPGPRFFLEFYYNPLAPGAEQQFTYTLSLTYAIERLEVDIQQPRHAVNFVIEPQPMKQTTDDQGLRYDWFTYSNLQPHATTSFHLSYTKSAPGTSVAERQPPPDDVTQPLSPTKSTLLALGIIVGVAAVVSSGIWLFKTAQRRRAKTPQPPSPAADGKPSSTTRTAAFCSNCGARLQPEHRFCPACGRQLRT